jgi:hypothetical protein
MVNNNGIPIEVNKKPFETVYELKDEYEIPSFEEFMETYEADEKVIDSYRDEVEYVNGLMVEHQRALDLVGEIILVVVANTEKGGLI